MKTQRLKFRFALAIAVVYLLLGVLTFLAFQLVTGRIVGSLGTQYAVKQALLEKSKLMSAIQRDLSLSIKMADSPLLRRWAATENDAELRRLASEELESYRTNFTGKSVFFAIQGSGHYYFSDGSTTSSLERPTYVLNPANPNDAWYFRTLRDVDPFELNADYDNHLNATKIWFNVVVKDAAGRKLGLGGSGIDITQFINEFVSAGEQGVETILFKGDGAIVGHRDRSYVLRNSRVRGDEKKISVYDLMRDGAEIEALRRAVAGMGGGGAETATLYLTLDGKRCLAAMAQLKEIGWFNLVLVDTSRVVSNRAFLPILLVTIVSLLALVVIVGLLLGRFVLVPLGGLAASADRIARGDFDIAMPVRSGDEIGALTRSFNTMARMVKDHSENLEQKICERTEALNEANLKLAESNRQVMDSIRYAQLIQASILPAGDSLGRCVREHFILYRPRDIVGGDFYFFRERGEDFILAVIDCTGHGVPGAFMTMTAHAVLGHVLGTLGDGDPAAILRELSRQLRAALHHDRADPAVDNGLDIGLCRYDAARRALTFAGARIDLLRVACGELTTLAGARQPIGYRRDNPDFTYANHTVIVEAEMMFYLASDGLLDQAGGARGWGFGRKRLGALLASIAALPAEGQQNALLHALDQYQGDHAQRDDITLIGFRL